MSYSLLRLTIFIQLIQLCQLELIEQSNYKRVCIYPNWASLRTNKQAQLFPENIDPHLCTHIHYIYADIDVRTLKLIPSLPEDIKSGKHGGPLYQRILQLKKINPKLKILISIGGWLVRSTPFDRILANKQTLQVFVKNVIEFLEMWKFDGIDVHWEYPGSIEFGALIESKTRYMLLIMYLHKEFAGKYLLSSFVPGYEKQIDNGYQVDFVCSYLDYISVETYDYSKSLKTGHNSLLHSDSNFSVAKSMDYWVKRGCAKSKLLIGLPTYAKGILIDRRVKPEIGLSGSFYTHESKYTGEEGIFSYYEICEKLGNSGTKTFWDNKAKMAYLVTNYSSDRQKSIWISYDNEKSAKEKAEYVKQNNFGGISIWSLDLDDFTGAFCSKGKYPITNAVKSVLETEVKKKNAIITDSLPKKDSTFITTRITHYIHLKDEWTGLQKLNSLKKFNYLADPNIKIIDSQKEINIEEKPLSYFQMMYKKYKSLNNDKVSLCENNENCYNYLKTTNNSGSIFGYYYYFSLTLVFFICMF